MIEFPAMYQADVIMSLAGSNGGSWSTTYAPKPAARPSTGENYSPKAENETTKASNLALIRELHGRSSSKASYTHSFGSGDQGNKFCSVNSWFYAVCSKTL